MLDHGAQPVRPLGVARARVVLDRGLLELSPVNCHPLVNHMTTAVSPEDLRRFLEAEGHEPDLLDLGAL